MAKQNTMTVKDLSVRTLKKDGVDYICITDIARQKNAVEPKDVVKNWMRQKNTLEYLGLWERLNNPLFKGVEFAPPFFDRAKLEKQKVYVDRYGVWLALVSWLTALLMLLGKFLRFLFWNLLLGVF